jgi:hypothetical protein
MGKVLNSFEFSARSNGGTSRYNWDELLDGKIRQLDEGTDFDCKPSTFLTLARSRAKARGLTVKGSKVEGGLVVQAVPASAEVSNGAAEDSAGERKGRKGRKGASA